MESGSINDGNRYIIDDFREAYYWLKQNTEKDAKILSWWDYGYQITGMSNRTVIVDNNTWNNTHIATVGKVLASNEEDGHQIAKSLDADYILVVFGGHVHYDGDDLAKFLWFVRIGASAYPEMDEVSYYGGEYQNQFGVADWQLSEKFSETLTYKFLYHRFGEVETWQGRGYDRPRETEIGVKDIHLKYFEEAYTSVNWMIRIYRVLPYTNRAGKFIAEDRVGLNLEEPKFSLESGKKFAGGNFQDIFAP